jgi:hypothetical protein
VIERVDPSRRGFPNIALQGDQALWIFNGALYRTDRATALAQFSTSAKVLSGERFAVVVTTSRDKFGDLFLVGKDGVERLSGLPPLLGTVKRIQATFSAETVWLLFTLEYEGVESRHVIVLRSDGELLALGAAPTDPQAWFAESALRAAYEVEEGGAKFHELAALAGGTLVKIRVDQDFRLVCHSQNPVSVPGEPIRLVYSPSGLQVGVNSASRPVPIVSGPVDAMISPATVAVGTNS